MWWSSRLWLSWLSWLQTKTRIFVLFWSQDLFCWSQQSLRFWSSRLRYLFFLFRAWIIGNLSVFCKWRYRSSVQNFNYSILRNNVSWLVILSSNHLIITINFHTNKAKITEFIYVGLFPIFSDICLWAMSCRYQPYS